MTHITSRIRGFMGEDNLSSLVYSAGFYQFTSSIQVCPLIGCGPGSPGYLGINIYNYLSNISSVPYYIEVASRLNMYDLYSLFFRTIVELGPILGGTLLMAIFFRFYNAIQLLLKRVTAIIRGNNSLPINWNKQIIELVAIMTWCFIFYIGSLLKEPHLFRSITFTPLMLGLIISGQISNLQKMSSSDIKGGLNPLRQ